MSRQPRTSCLGPGGITRTLFVFVFVIRGSSVHEEVSKMYTQLARYKKEYDNLMYGCDWPTDHGGYKIDNTSKRECWQEHRCVANLTCIVTMPKRRGETM